MIVYQSSTVRGPLNIILAFIFISCNQDFLPLRLFRHLELWTLGQGPLLRREDAILACGERKNKRYTQTDRKEGKKRKHVREKEE